MNEFLTNMIISKTNLLQRQIPFYLRFTLMTLLEMIMAKTCQTIILPQMASKLLLHMKSTCQMEVSLKYKVETNHAF